MNMEVIAQRGVALTAFGVMCYASCAVAHKATKRLAKMIYPLSVQEGEDLTGCRPLPKEDWFSPNFDIRISREEYKALSTARKILNAAAVILTGAIVGAATAGMICGIVGLAVHAAPLFTIVGIISGIAMGCLAGMLLDPKIGAPALYSAYFSHD